MAGRLIDLDPELAYEHTQAAVRRGGRIDIVREAAGIAAYATGRYAEALRELRTVRRLNGSSEHLPIMADAERGLGRPERAIALAAAPEADTLHPAAKVELALVVSGARSDLGEHDAALVVLDKLAPQQGDLALRVLAARAAALQAAGREDEAAALLATVDPEDLERATGNSLPDEDVVVYDIYDDEADELEDEAADSEQVDESDTDDLDDTDLDDTDLDDTDLDDTDLDERDLDDTDVDDLDKSDELDELDADDAEGPVGDLEGDVRDDAFDDEELEDWESAERGRSGSEGNDEDLTDWEAGSHDRSAMTDGGDDGDHADDEEMTDTAPADEGDLDTGAQAGSVAGEGDAEDSAVSPSVGESTEGETANPETRDVEEERE